MPSIKDSLKAVYYIETNQDLKEVAEQLAELETTGKWSSKNHKPTNLFERCRGEVLEIKEFEKGKGFVSLLFPLINFNMKESAFSSVWLSMIGGATHALVNYEKSRLVDFELPDFAYKYFPGPGWGLDKTKEYLGISKNEPVLGTIVKPTSGLTADEVADMCYQFGLGGLQFIKDDEKMLNTDYCPLEERVKKVATALKKAEDITGKRVLYAPHLTTGPENIIKFAEIALKNGANALMINIFAASFSSLKILREQSYNVPIYAHCGGKEAFGRAEGQGVSPEVIVKFARLMGGDYFKSNILGGYLVGGKIEEIKSLNHIMTMPIYGIKKVMPALSGGLKPGNLFENLREFGTDVMLLAGTGITQYPGGITAGVEEMKEVVNKYKKTYKTGIKIN
ncbi:MAG: RuBisCO large subunit C-terminal-like domain-containing protein [Actinobacteria bacterium]|nr:RuBisCO large subunit C-terminal-like domain-containing protein [Actinomycetota bacterium]